VVAMLHPIVVVVRCPVQARVRSLGGASAL